MSKCWLALLAGSVVLSGCTSLSLERNTLRQIDSVEQFRYQSTMNCLAVVAANTGSLPSYGLLINGTSHVMDTANLTSTTGLTRALAGFATESIAASLSRQLQPLWSVDPVGDYDKLEALRCSCVWALNGEQAACEHCGHLLEDPEIDYSPQEPRFGVAEQLRRLPAGWIHMGCLTDVPARARWKAHHEGTWVWVMPEDSWCLSEFILVMHDISTIDLDAVVSQPLLVTITQTNTVGLDTNGSVPQPGKQLNPLTPPQGPAANQQKSFSFDEIRVVRPEKRREIEQMLQDAISMDANKNHKIVLTWQQWMDYTYAYNGTRTNAKAAGGAQPPGGSKAALQQQYYLSTRGNFFMPSVVRSPLPPPTPDQLRQLNDLLRKVEEKTAPDGKAPPGN